MSEEKILTPLEWTRKDEWIKENWNRWSIDEYNRFEKMQKYAEYYHEMKMKEILQKQEEEKILRDYLNQCYVRNQKT